jgi:hypothetical protein
MKVQVMLSSIGILLLSFAMGGCGAGEVGSDSEFAVALKLSDAATAADAGLPTYPGSKPYEDSERSSSAANLGVSTPMFGFNVVAMKLQTTDAPERVAAFYRQALSRYGNVLDCSDAGDAQQQSRSGGEDDALTCDAAGTHEVVYKVGTEKNQRIVAIKPYGSGARFSLVHLKVRGDVKQ